MERYPKFLCIECKTIFYKINGKYLPDIPLVKCAYDECHDCSATPFFGYNLIELTELAEILYA